MPPDMTFVPVVRGDDESSRRSLLRPVPSRRLSCLTRSVRRLRRGAIASLVVEVICVGMPIWLYVASAPVSRSIHSRMEANPEAARMLEQADSYNERLLAYGGGEYGNIPAETGVGLKSDQDQVYTSALAGPDTVMGAIRIPRLSVNLDIRHGTGDRALSQGTGHYYGTMLPTGSESVSVIAAHRGLGSRLLFLRLGEFHQGDPVYTNTFDSALAWRVRTVELIAPDSEQERDLLRSSARERLLRLYTCDPIGLNTRRLVVTAQLTDMPATVGRVTGVAPVMVGLSIIAAGAALLLLRRLMFEKVSLGKHIERYKTQKV